MPAIAPLSLLDAFIMADCLLGALLLLWPERK